MHDDRFDRSLAERLSAYESRIPDEPAPSAGYDRRPPWAALIGVGAVGLVAAAILAIVLVNAPTDGIGDASPSPSATVEAPSPSATGPATPGQSPRTEEPSPTEAPAPPIGGVAWQPEVAGGRDGYVRRITAEGDRFFALGSIGQDAVIWSSVDGLDWDETALPFPESWNLDAPVFIYATNLVTVDGRLIALGTVGALDNLNVVVWEQVDGAEWIEIDTGPFMEAAFNALDVTAGPAGLVVVTHHYAPGTGSAWRSADGGRTWTEHRPPGEAVEAYAVVGTGAGYLIGGSVGVDLSSAGPSPRIWDSTDGATWAEATLEGSYGEGQVEQLTVDGAGRWVAVGKLDGRAVAWRSDDGSSWTLTADFRPVGENMRAEFRLAGIPDGYLAFDPADPIVSWLSSDGVAWTPSEQPMPGGIQSTVTWTAGIARIGDTLIVAGEDTSPEGEQFGWFTWTGSIQR